MMRDHYGDDVWVDILLENIKDYTGNVIVSDVRLKNEYAALKQHGFFIVDVVKANRIEHVENASHISEVDLDGASFDYTIHNDGSLDDLKKNIIDMIGYLRTLHI